MQEPDAVTAAASRLCTACGMCCNGVLFHIVKLQPSDSVKALETVGMKLSRKKKEPYFNQPCRFLHDCTCGIYEVRPKRCRLFECRQIQGLVADEITEQQAGAVIHTARAQLARVEALLADAGNTEVHRPLAERCQDALSAHEAPETAPLKAAMTEMEALLDRHFRPSKQG